MATTTSYLIAGVVLFGIWATPLFIIWCISFCTARRKGDPARSGIGWVKAVFPLWILALVLFTVAYGLLVWLELALDSVYIDYDRDTLSAISRTSDSIWGVSWLFKYLSDILILVTLVELGSGFVLCITGANRLHKPIRFTALGVAFVLFILDIAWFGLLMKYFDAYYAYLADPDPALGTGEALSVDSRTLEKLSGSLDVLLWLACLPTVVYAGYVVHKARAVPHLRNSAGLLLAATILNFVRMISEMAITATYYLPLNPPDMPRYVPFVVRPVLDCIPMFVLLILLFTIGIRKQKGLWSTPQQQRQWPVGGVAYVPGGPAPQQPPIVWQGQPQVQFQAQPYYAYPQQYTGYPQQQQPPSGHLQHPVQNNSQPGAIPPAQQPQATQEPKTMA